MHDLQFGFTKGGGCDKALLIFKSVVEYYNERESTIFAAALDLTKAYDRLNHCVLILKLCKIGIPGDLIMLFMFWFQNLCGVVVWGNNESLRFNIRSGVRQGGVCSCWLFNIYVNDLVIRLEKQWFRLYDV